MIRMLALVPGGISDQILFFPTLDDLKRHYPQAQIDVIVEPQAKSAYQVCKLVHKVMVFDYESRNGLSDWVNLISSIRDGQYDVVFSAGQHWTMAALLWLSGIPTRIGYGGSIGELLLTNPAQLEPEQYEADRYHDLLQGLGITTPCPELTISVPKSAFEWAEAEQKRLNLLGSQGGNYVLIHSDSGQLAQTKGIDELYPVENWQKIIQDFQEHQPDLAVVAIQWPENQEWVTAIRKVAPNLKVTAPGDIGKLAAIIATASLIVCTNNSAPMHLAVAAQTYLIGLFGLTDPARLLPASDRFIGLKSPTGRIADISPGVVLERVWGA